LIFLSPKWDRDYVCHLCMQGVGNGLDTTREDLSRALMV
jgi:hypothetical protein